MLGIQPSEIKVFYDRDGQAQEVLMSYDAFCRIESLLEQLRQDPDQGYFWSDEWQARIREGEADIRAGRTLRVAGTDVERALEWLDEKIIEHCPNQYKRNPRNNCVSSPRILAIPHFACTAYVAAADTGNST